MKNYGIIFAGFPNSGKRQMLATMSDIGVTHVKKAISYEVMGKKCKANVMMDYGVMKVSATESVNLCAMRHKETFKVIKALLANNDIIGLVLLINNADFNRLDELSLFVQKLFSLDQKVNLGIAITNVQEGEFSSIADYHRKFGAMVKSVPVFEIDIKSYKSTALLTEALLLSICPELQCLSTKP